MPKIGVLALQGDFREHREAMERLQVATREVRLPRDLDGLDGLIIPGGESTTIVRLMRSSGLLEPLADPGARRLPDVGNLRRHDPPGQAA